MQRLLLPHTPNVGLTNALMASVAAHPFMGEALRLLPRYAHAWCAPNPPNPPRTPSTPYTLRPHTVRPFHPSHSSHPVQRRPPVAGALTPLTLPLTGLPAGAPAPAPALTPPPTMRFPEPEPLPPTRYHLSKHNTVLSSTGSTYVGALFTLAHV